MTRLVRRLAPYVRDGAVRQSRLERVIRSVAPLDGYAALEAEVVAALRTAGVAVEDDTPEVAPAADDQPAEPVVADERIEVDQAAALDAARDLLQRLRSTRHRSRSLLTAEQEVGLALLARPEGMGPSEDLPEDLRRSLPDDSEQAQAFDALITHNLRLAWSIAQRYMGQVSHMDAEDIVGHAYLGLIRAVQKYDASKGFKFSTYATWWIRQSITRAIYDQDRLIRIPVHLGEKMQRTRNAYNRLLAAGIRPTLGRLAGETGFDEDEIARHFQLMQGILSLDKPVGDDGTTIGELVAAEEAEQDGLLGLNLEVLRAQIDKMLTGLTEREAGVIRLRMGFFDGEPWTLEQIGVRYAVTRERIRQIEGKAMGKLKTPASRAQLKDWA